MSFVAKLAYRSNGCMITKCFTILYTLCALLDSFSIP